MGLTFNSKDPVELEGIIKGPLYVRGSKMDGVFEVKNRVQTNFTAQDYAFTTEGGEIDLQLNRAQGTTNISMLKGAPPIQMEGRGNFSVHVDNKEQTRIESKEGTNLTAVYQSNEVGVQSEHPIKAVSQGSQLSIQTTEAGKVLVDAIDFETGVQLSKGSVYGLSDIHVQVDTKAEGDNFTAQTLFKEGKGEVLTSKGLASLSFEEALLNLDYQEKGLKGEVPRIVNLQFFLPFK